MQPIIGSAPHMMPVDRLAHAIGPRDRASYSAAITAKDTPSGAAAGRRCAPSGLSGGHVHANAQTSLVIAGAMAGAGMGGASYCGKDSKAMAGGAASTAANRHATSEIKTDP